MAKGKYKARKENRDAFQLAEDLARARTQLREEQRRLVEVRERAERDAQLRADLAEAIAARDAACAPQLARIASDRDVIRAATRQLTDLTRDIARHWQKVSEWGWTEFGPETYYAILSGKRAFVTEGVASRRLKSAATEAIQRARGVRTESALDFTAQQKMALGMAVAAATGTELPDDVTAVDGPEWDAYIEQVQADSAAVIAFKSPPPWLDIAAMDTHPISQLLGASSAVAEVTVNAPDALPNVVELSTGTAALREAVAAAGAHSVAEAYIDTLQHRVTQANQSQIPTMVASSAAYPAPADAAAMQAWYAASAMGAWARHRTTANAQVAVAAAAAVPFWLPPGHTIAYLDSDPLSGEDIEDIRLPFAQVLVAFAEPPRLPAINPGPLADDPRMKWIDYIVGSGEGLPGVKDMIIGGTDEFQSPLPTLWDVIAARGAHVEAVLLLADAHGRLEDLFAWCVMIPSHTAGGALGRWVIAASRRATRYSSLIANAAAVAAWADWHRPGQARGLDEQDVTAGGEAPRQQRRPEDTVHVLNVTATTPVDPQSSAAGEPTGRTTAPHRRRGHWRRQHFGPGRTQTRRIRIAPVMVNAGRLGADRPQIYRLPTPKAS